MTAMKGMVVFAPLNQYTIGGPNDYNGSVNGHTVQSLWQSAAGTAASGNGFMRIWAPWHWCQPYTLDYTNNVINIASLNPSAPWNGTGNAMIDCLDRQLAAAKAQGIKVVLTAYKFALFSNGGAQWQLANAGYDLSKWRSDERQGGPDGLKEAEFGFPNSVQPGSYWANWINFLCQRYGTNGPNGLCVNYLEIVNEPNFQCWPQGSMAIQVGQMFATAAPLAYNNGITPAGPGLSDVEVPTSGSNFTHWMTATGAIVASFAFNGFNPGQWNTQWTHHNYGDIERPLRRHQEIETNSYVLGLGNPPSPTTGVPPSTSAEWVRDRIRRYGWNGYNSTLSGLPAVMITEGGPRWAHSVDVSSNAPYALASDAGPLTSAVAQGVLVEHMVNRMTATEGITHFADYQLVDPGFNDVHDGCGVFAFDGSETAFTTKWRQLRSDGRL